MLLEGHQGEIFCTEFHPDGEMLLSSGFDRQICMSTQEKSAGTQFILYLSCIFMCRYLECLW